MSLPMGKVRMGWLHDRAILDHTSQTLPTAVLNETTGIYLSNENPSFARNDIKARASATGLNQMEDTYFA